MSESLIGRVRRLVSGGVADIVDAMERAGGEAVMREAIREVEHAMNEVKEELGQVKLRRLQAGRQSAMIRRKLAELEEKARFALDQGRDDLAEAALSRQVDLEDHIARIEVELAQGCEAESEFETAVAALGERKRQMETELKVHREAKRELDLASVAEQTSGLSGAGKKVDRAEQAFRRAMEGAGGTEPLDPAKGRAALQVAEIDGMQRSIRIAERLASLKSLPKAG
jgi:phage shock protein A